MKDSNSSGKCDGVELMGNCLTCACMEIRTLAGCLLIYNEVELIDQCNELIDQCNELIDQCNELIDQCNELIDQCNELIDQCNELIDQCNELIDQCNELIDQCNEFIDQCNEFIDQCNGLFVCNITQTFYLRLNMEQKYSSFIMKIKLTD